MKEGGVGMGGGFLLPGEFVFVVGGDDVCC